jgi:hypothetical protein
MAKRSSSKTPDKKYRLVGKYKQVRVVIAGASFLTPEGRASDKPIDDALGLFILDEIFRRQSILSRLKGLLRKTHHCRSCDADLMGLKAHGRRFSIKIEYKKLPPFQVEIDMPAIPCRNCGTSNAVNEQATEFVISGAIAKAFESAKRTT